MSGLYQVYPECAGCKLTGCTISAGGQGCSNPKVNERLRGSQGMITINLGNIAKLQAENTRLRKELDIEHNLRLEAEAEIDKIKGIVGHPGTNVLPWECPTSDVVRYLHHEWLRQQHAAGQRVINAEMEADHAKAELAAANGRVAQLVEALEPFAMTEIAADTPDYLGFYALNQINTNEPLTIRDLKRAKEAISTDGGATPSGCGSLSE